MLNLTFVMEQQLGHRAYYLNLREALEKDPRVKTQWIEVTYENPTQRLKRFPLIPETVFGSLVGRQQILDGLHGRRHDAVFFNTQVPAVLVKDQLGKAPYLLSTDITPLQYDRMADLYNHTPDSAGPLQKVKYKVNRSTFQRAKRILPWSTWTAESVIAEYAVRPEQVEVVAPGVDIDVWKPRTGSARRTCPRILFVGGDLERKGGLDLLEVFKSLPQGAAELVLVTRAAVATTPDVRVIHNLLPNSAELIALYQSSDLFVLPSQAEAFGIAVAEASAAGLPVITTSVGGLRDIVLHNQTGFTVEPGNREQLKTALTQLLADESQRKAFGQAARTRAEQRFDAKKNACRTLEIILEACNP